MEAQETASFIVKEGLRAGMDEVAAIVTHNTSRQIRFGNNEITVTKTWNQIGARILLKMNKKILIAFISELSQQGIQHALEDLKSMIRVMAPHQDYAPLPEGPFTYRDIAGLYDHRIPRLYEKNVDYVEAALNAATAQGAERTAGTLQTTDSETALTTSRSVEATKKKTTIEMVVRCLSNGESSGMGLTCGTNVKDFDPEAAGRQAGRLAADSAKLKPGTPGKYDILLSAIAAATLFDIFGGMSSAFYVDSGRSCIADKIGAKIASEKLTVYDDATASEGLGSTPFDDEGQPTGRTPIIQEGILQTYLHNNLTAQKHVTKTTANAGWISPRPWNIIVDEGTHTSDELLAETHNGLYINNLTYVRFQDYRKGDFSASTRDGVFKIQDGELGDAIKGLRLSANLLSVLQNITGLSEAAQQITHWWMEWGTPAVKTPLIRIRDVGFTVTTK